MFLLDTNACIGYLKGNSAILQKMATVPRQDIAVCSIVKAELFYGAMRSNNPQRTLQTQQTFLAPFQSFPFDDAAVMTYAQIRAQLTAQGTPIGPNDLQIAAIALTYDLTLITHNVREFNRVENLKIEDWQANG